MKIRQKEEDDWRRWKGRTGDKKEGEEMKGRIISRKGEGCMKKGVVQDGGEWKRRLKGEAEREEVGKDGKEETTDRR